MMNAQETQVSKKHIKLIYANIKPKCAKTFPKWATALIDLNANLRMAYIKCQIAEIIKRKLTEQKNVNRFGKREYAVTGFDANFFIMIKIKKIKKNSLILLVQCFAVLQIMQIMEKAD